MNGAVPLRGPTVEGAQRLRRSPPSRVIFWIAAGCGTANPTRIVARTAARPLVKYAERSTSRALST